MIDALGKFLRTAHAVRMLTDTLNGGFTAVRKNGVGNHTRLRRGFVF